MVSRKDDLPEPNPSPNSDGSRAAPKSIESAAFTHAVDLVQRGLAVLPLGGNDGKVPLVKGWAKFSKPPSAATVARWVVRHHEANIGILPGLCGLVIVDIDSDDPEVVDAMTRRFGRTELVVRTPSGGRHLYYSTTERVVSIDLRPSEGLPVEIKAHGCVVAVPPSRNPVRDRSYVFEVGDWSCLSRLPQIPSEALRVAAAKSRVGEGARNSTLFKRLLAEAARGLSQAELSAAAEQLNQTTVESPLGSEGLAGIVKSVWGYQSEGRNWVGQEARVTFTRSDIRAFATVKNGDRALILFSILQMAHRASGRPFAIAREAMAHSAALPGWSAHRIRTARDALVKMGLIYKVPKERNSRATRYAFSDKPTANAHLQGSAAAVRTANGSGDPPPQCNGDRPPAR